MSVRRKPRPVAISAMIHAQAYIQNRTRIAGYNVRYNILSLRSILSINLRLVREQ